MEGEGTADVVTDSKFHKSLQMYPNRVEKLKRTFSKDHSGQHYFL